jgi:hypothetical protein
LCVLCFTETKMLLNPNKMPEGRSVKFASTNVRSTARQRLTLQKLKRCKVSSESERRSSLLLYFTPSSQTLDQLFHPDCPVDRKRPRLAIRLLITLKYACLFVVFAVYVDWLTEQSLRQQSLHLFEKQVSLQSAWLTICLRLDDLVEKWGNLSESQCRNNYSWKNCYADVSDQLRVRSIERFGEYLTLNEQLFMLVEGLTFHAPMSLSQILSTKVQAAIRSGTGFWLGNKVCRTHYHSRLQTELVIYLNQTLYQQLGVQLNFYLSEFGQTPDLTMKPLASGPIDGTLEVLYTRYMQIDVRSGYSLKRLNNNDLHTFKKHSLLTMRCYQLCNRLRNPLNDATPMLFDPYLEHLVKHNLTRSFDMSRDYLKQLRYMKCAPCDESPHWFERRAPPHHSENFLKTVIFLPIQIRSSNQYFFKRTGIVTVNFKEEWNVEVVVRRSELTVTNVVYLACSLFGVVFGFNCVRFWQLIDRCYRGIARRLAERCKRAIRVPSVTSSSRFKWRRLTARYLYLSCVMVALVVQCHRMMRLWIQNEIITDTNVRLHHRLTQFTAVLCFKTDTKFELPELPPHLKTIFLRYRNSPRFAEMFIRSVGIQTSDISAELMPPINWLHFVKNITLLLWQRSLCLHFDMSFESNPLRPKLLIMLFRLPLEHFHLSRIGDAIPFQSRVSNLLNSESFRQIRVTDNVRVDRCHSYSIERVQYFQKTFDLFCRSQNECRYSCFLRISRHFFSQYDPHELVLLDTLDMLDRLLQYNINLTISNVLISGKFSKVSEFCLAQFNLPDCVRHLFLPTQTVPLQLTDYEKVLNLEHTLVDISILPLIDRTKLLFEMFNLLGIAFGFSPFMALLFANRCVWRMIRVLLSISSTSGRLQPRYFMYNTVGLLLLLFAIHFALIWIEYTSGEFITQMDIVPRQIFTLPSVSICFALKRQDRSYLPGSQLSTGWQMKKQMRPFRHVFSRFELFVSGQPHRFDSDELDVQIATFIFNYDFCYEFKLLNYSHSVDLHEQPMLRIFFRHEKYTLLVKQLSDSLVLHSKWRNLVHPMRVNYMQTRSDDRQQLQLLIVFRQQQSKSGENQSEWNAFQHQLLRSNFDDKLVQPFAAKLGLSASMKRQMHNSNCLRQYLQTQIDRWNHSQEMKKRKRIFSTFPIYSHLFHLPIYLSEGINSRVSDLERFEPICQIEYQSVGQRLCITSRTNQYYCNQSSESKFRDLFVEVTPLNIELIYSQVLKMSFSHFLVAVNTSLLFWLGLNWYDVLNTVQLFTLTALTRIVRFKTIAPARS